MSRITRRLCARTLCQGAVLIKMMTVIRANDSVEANDCDSGEGEAVNANTLLYPLSRLLMARPTCYRLRTSEGGAGVMQESRRRANDDEAVSGRRSLSVDPCNNSWPWPSISTATDVLIP
jgi:hypothetical protein